MILNGECGAFQPLLLECLVESSDIVQKEMAVDTITRGDQRIMENTAAELVQYEDLSTTDRTLRVLEQERIIHHFFSSVSRQILFEYTSNPSMLTLSPAGVERLGLDETIVDPYHNQQFQDMVDPDTLAELALLLQSTSPDQPTVEFDCDIKVDGQPLPVHLICRAMWSSEAPPEYTGAIGMVSERNKKEEP